MRAIFISYRREDAEGQAGRLFDDLVRHFGADSVFMDVAGIEPGRDFRRVIDEHVASCGVLLAMIGKSWLDAADESQRRRLEDPMDFVRLETASALKRDIPVVPVLVHGARMPKAEQLPKDLAELAYRNGVELTHARWDSDVQVLIKALTPHVESIRESSRGLDMAEPPAPSTTPAARSARPAGIPRDSGTAQSPKKSFTIVAASLAALAVLVIAAGGYVWFRISFEQAAVVRQAALLEMAKKQAEAERLEARRQVEAKAVADALEIKKQAEARAMAAQAEADKRAREIAAAEERDRIKIAQEKAAAGKREADIKAQQIADARKREAETREREIALEERERIGRDREKALADERGRIKLAQDIAIGAQRARWPTRNFPPPNGGLLVYTIRPDGNPACASYDGGGCLWGMNYDQIDFKRLKPLACGQEHRAKWGVTGYEDPKHWCSLARTLRVSR